MKDILRIEMKPLKRRALTGSLTLKSLASMREDGQLTSVHSVLNTKPFLAPAQTHKSQICLKDSIIVATTPRAATPNLRRKTENTSTM
jgi:hypothetical protein